MTEAARIQRLRSLVAACHTEACAPPPHGTGGSRPGAHTGQFEVSKMTPKKWSAWASKQMFPSSLGAGEEVQQVKAINGPETLGTMTVVVGPKGARVAEIRVAGKHQRKGVATALMDRLKENTDGPIEMGEFSPEGKKWFDSYSAKSVPEVDTGSEEIDAEYRGHHQPAKGPPLHDLLEGDMMPADVYENPQWYTGYTDRKILRETTDAIKKARGNPDALVTIYRGAPAGSKSINNGDWVTLSREYARQHGFDPTDPSKDWPVYSIQVPARHVLFAGDDLMEFGYWGPATPAITASAMRLSALIEEFKCTDDACAPPPIGTGGSIPGARVKSLAKKMASKTGANNSPSNAKPTPTATKNAGVSKPSVKAPGGRGGVNKCKCIICGRGLSSAEACARGIGPGHLTPEGTLSATARATAKKRGVDIPTIERKATKHGLSPAELKEKDDLMPEIARIERPGMHFIKDGDREAFKAKYGAPIPPAWKHVQITDEDGSALLAIGYDGKGRDQRIYSAEYSANQAAEKFGRIAELEKVIDTLDARLEKDAETDPAAAALVLLRRMGMRPGSNNNTGAEEQAFGATNLNVRDVRVSDTSATLTFVAKKGVRTSLKTNDPLVMQTLRQWTEGKKAGDPLFQTSTGKAVPPGRLGIYLKGVLPGYKPKDLRTFHGTSYAAALVAKSPKPKNAADAKKLQKEIAVKVSDELGNTPVIALASYISPVVWGPWSDV